MNQLGNKKVAPLLQSFHKLLTGVNGRQFLLYGMSVGGTMAASFVMLAVLVRILPAEIYGGLVLTKAVLLVVVSLAGMGLSQSAVHWGGRAAQAKSVLGTILGGASLAALPAAILLVIVVAALADRLKLVVTLPLIAAILILILSYTLNNELLNWQRAQHHAKRHASASILRAVQQLIAIIAGLLIFNDTAGYIYGLAASELLLLCWWCLIYRGGLEFQAKLLREMLSYGWPHMMVIISGLILSYADRYMLALLSGDNSVVAYYDAATTAVVSALALLVRPFNLFMFPEYTKRYKESTIDATAHLVNRAQRLFLIAGIGISTLLVAVREPLLNILFPAEYSVASSIFPLVTYSTIINGVFMTTVAGLYISKRTVIVGAIAMVAALVNISTNWFLIPAFGMNGAASGALIASLVQLALGYHVSRKFLPLKFPIRLICGGALWLGSVYWVF